jgi:hypothetical protein
LQPIWQQGNGWNFADRTAHKKTTTEIHPKGQTVGEKNPHEIACVLAAAIWRKNKNKSVLWRSGDAIHKSARHSANNNWWSLNGFARWLMKRLWLLIIQNFLNAGKLWSVCFFFELIPKLLTC